MPISCAPGTEQRNLSSSQNMSLCSDPAIAEAYQDVRDDKTSTNWLLLTYKEDVKPDTLYLAGKGSGGLQEFTNLLKPDMAAFGYVRMVMANDELSQRSKFVLVNYCGSEVKVMRRAKLSVHLAEVKSTIKVFSVEVSASSPADLKEADVLLKLKKAGGANYDRQGSSY